MKIQRSKIGKIIALSGILTITAAVPAAVLSSAVLNGDSFANNQSGDASIPSGPSTGPLGPSNPSLPSEQENNKIKVKLKSSIQIMGSEDIYDVSSNKTMNELLAQKIKDNPSIAFENPNVLSQKDFNVIIEGNLSNSTWQGENFNVNNGNWGTSIDQNRKLYYFSQSPDFVISSLDDFKSKLNTGSKLKDCLTAACLEVDSNTTPSIKNKLGLSNGLFHINVEATVSGNKMDYDLQIPTSNVNFEVNNLSVKVSGDEIAESQQTINFSYIVGVKSISQYTGPSNIVKIDSETSINTVMTTLGFASNSSSESSLILDDKKIGIAFGVFNSTFTNPKLELDKSANLDGNYIAYKVSVTATPKQGYQFDDGDTYKEFSFPIKITERTAYFIKKSDNTTAFKNQTFAWRNTGIPNATHAQVEKRLDDYANGRNNDPTIKAFLDEMTASAKNYGILKNASFVLLKYGNVRYTIPHGNRWRIYLTTTPDKGFENQPGLPWTLVLSQIWIPN